MARTDDRAELAGSGRAQMVTILGSASLGLTVISLAFGGVELVDETDRFGLLAWDTILDGAIGGGALAFSKVGLAGMAIHFAFVIALALFFHRACHNALALGAKDLKVSPAMAGWGFFIPILNLFKPYQTADALWGASDVDAAREGRAPEDSSLLSVWWALWLLNGFVSRFQQAAQQGNDWRTAVVLGIVGDLLYLGAVLAALLFCRALWRRQLEQRSLSRPVPMAEAVAHVPWMAGGDAR